MQSPVGDFVVVVVDVRPFVNYGASFLLMSNSLLMCFDDERSRV